MRQVLHDKESASLAKWVHIVRGNVDFDAFFSYPLSLIFEPQRLFEVGGLVGRVELNCHLLWEEQLSVFLG